MLCLPAPRSRGHYKVTPTPPVIYLPAALDPEPELGITITFGSYQLRTNGIKTPDIGAELAALMARVGDVQLVEVKQLELWELERAG